MEKIKENKLGIDPIGKLLFTVSFPIIISMLIQALYNMVDSYYIGKISEEAFTAVSIAFPLQNIMVGIAVGTGVGTNSLLSRSLGEKNFDKANLSAENGIFLSILYGIILLILSFVLPRYYYISQNVSQEIVNYGVEYLSTIMAFSMGVFIQINCERLLQSTGRSILTMFTQGIGALINIIFDPIFIFGYFGFPAMGVKGAAIATVVGQIIGALFGIYFNFKLNKDIQIKKIRPRLQIIKKIYEVGLPSIVMISVTSTTIYFLNKILSIYSTSAIAALGAYYKIQSFIFLPIFGLTNGMVPIIAYNYGAENKKRIIKTIKLTMIVGTIMMILGTAILWIFPEELLDIFSASDAMKEVGITMLRIIALCFIFAGISIMGGSVFQALGNGILTLIDAVIRNIIIILPYTYIVSRIAPIEYVWWSYLLSETSSIIFVSYFMKNFAMKRIDLIKESI